MDDVTIAILSAIEPPLPECLEAVEKQEGGPYRVVHIKDVFPMSAAFNAMILATDARFVVQVDGDVVLERWAVSKLLKGITGRPWTYMAWGQLFQEGFGLGGSVRIWRRWPLRFFRFRDRRCVDRDLHTRIRLTAMGRFEAFGPAGRHTVPRETFGTHCPRQSPFARFSKAKGDCLKWEHLERYDLLESFPVDRRIHQGQVPVPEALGLYAASLCTKRKQSKNLRDDWLDYQKLRSLYASSQGEAAAQEGLRRL